MWKPHRPDSSCPYATDGVDKPHYQIVLTKPYQMPQLSMLLRPLTFPLLVYVTPDSINSIDGVTVHVWKKCIFVPASTHLNISVRPLDKYCQNGIDSCKSELLQAHKIQTTLSGNITQQISAIKNPRLYTIIQ